jgi:DNA-binding MarR family transcriptional regulator
VTDTAPLDAEQLAAYFALMEVSSRLRHAVEQQLRSAGGLSYVQFQILAGLSDSPTGRQRMTDLADRIVYSRSGLTYQAGQLEKAGLITRSPSVEDERSTTVTITAAGRALVARVLPAHMDLVRQLLLDPLTHRDMTALTKILSRVRDSMRTAPPRSAAPRRRTARRLP